MPALSSALRSSDPSFVQRREQMLAHIARFRHVEDRVRATSDAQKSAFDHQGKLLPRARVHALRDPGSSWLELSTLAGLGMHDDDGEGQVMGGGVIAGIGVVCGISCVLIASDSAIKGGTLSPMGVQKTLRAQVIAMTHKLPVISMVESGGANLHYQSELFIEGGKTFYNQARMSAMGLPQITLVHGNSTAGGAYMPGLSDYVILVKDQAKVFLAGPPLLRAATGEIAEEEELGGARMHASLTGLGEYVAEDDRDAIRIAREVVAHVASALFTQSPASPPPPQPLPPRHDPDALCGVIPSDYREPYDVREVWARVLDDSDFLEFKASYGSWTVCGHGAIEGSRCGLVGNNGPIDHDGAAKVAQFLQLCDQAGLPVVFFQNTTGFMVGTVAERAGIIKHGAKMIQAVSNIRVPRITLNVGASFGAGNYGMCGRSYDPNFLFSWPHSKLAVMGGEQVAGVMEIVARQKAERRGKEVDEGALGAMKKSMKDRLEAESDVLFTSARLWDDGIIDPRDTRQILGLTLRLCAQADRQLLGNTFGVGRM